MLFDKQVSQLNHVTDHADPVIRCAAVLVAFIIRADFFVVLSVFKKCFSCFLFFFLFCMMSRTILH